MDNPMMDLTSYAKSSCLITLLFKVVHALSNLLGMRAKTTFTSSRFFYKHTTQLRNQWGNHTLVLNSPSIF